MKKYVMNREEFILNESKKMNEEIESGRYYKLDRTKLKGIIPQQMKIINKISKHGDVYVVSVDGNEALCSESPMGAMLGTVEIPLTALKECLVAEETKKLNETGEWDSSDPDLKAWIKSMGKDMKTIEHATKGKFTLAWVKGFDAYQGPEAQVKIQGLHYTVWCLSDDLYYIEDFIDNTKKYPEYKDSNPGWIGDIDEIIDIVNKNGTDL